MEGRARPRPASGRIPDRVEAREDPPALRFGCQTGKGPAVQAVHDERAREVEGLPGVQEAQIELVGHERPVRTWHVEECPLAHRVDEDDGRRGGNRLVAKHALSVDSTLVQEPDEKVSERVRPDLADDRRGEPERDERARSVQSTSSAVHHDLVDEAERARRRRLVDGVCDDVGNEDAEADDVHVALKGGADATEHSQVALHANVLGRGRHREGGTGAHRSAVDPPFPLDDEKDREPATRLDERVRPEEGTGLGWQADDRLCALRSSAASAAAHPSPRWVSSGRIGKPRHSQRIE